MKRSGPLKRTTRLKARGKSRFPKRRNPDYLAWIRTLPCVIWGQDLALLRPRDWCSPIPGQRYGVEAAHVKTRGSGGNDVGNTVPLCPWHHDEQEGATAAFNEKYKVDLAAIAARLAIQYQEEQCGGTS